MRNMIIAVLAVALSSGVAAADHYRGGVVVHERGRPVVVEHRAVVRGPVVHERVVVGGGPRVVVGGGHYVYRNPHILPPAMRVEHYRPLVGYTWSPGYYSWVGGDYMWINGHYLRERPGYRWRPAEWVVVGGVPTFRAGVGVTI